jgi:hypothetical protein
MVIASIAKSGNSRGDSPSFELATMRKKIFVAILLICLGLVAWEFIPIQVMVRDGGYDLTVHVAVPPGDPRLVQCGLYARKKDAEEGAELWLSDAIGLKHTAWTKAYFHDPFDDRPFEFMVPTSGRVSPMGRSIASFRFQYLVVAAELESGERIVEIVEIPHPKVTREITVTLP